MTLVTIRDVAKLAGVVPSTVSNTLNGRGYVSEETRARVMRAVQELGYQPNVLASGLKSGRTNVIALIVPTISTPMFSEMIEGVEEVAAAADCNLILCRSGRDPGRELSYLSLFRGGRADGIIIAAPHVDDPCFDEVSKCCIPVVIAGTRPPDASIPSVIVDNKKGAAEAMSHLLDLGHTRIGFINGPLSVFDSRERFEAVNEIWSRAGLPQDDLIHREADFSRSQGYSVARTIMQVSPAPTALFVAGDNMAIGAVQAVRDMGLAIPDDVSIVGFDDIRYSQYVDPPLTTVRQPADKVGQKATHMLLSLVRGKKVRRRHVILDVNLQVRASSAKRR